MVPVRGSLNMPPLEIHLAPVRVPSWVPAVPGRPLMVLKMQPVPEEVAVGEGVFVAVALEPGLGEAEGVGEGLGGGHTTLLTTLNCRSVKSVA